MPQTKTRTARELGLTLRGLSKWIKEEGCPWPATPTQIRQWAGRMGKKSFAAYAGDDPADNKKAEHGHGTRAEWELRYKKSQALLNEAKLKQEKEKFLLQKREELQAEAEAFLRELITVLNKLALPPDVATRLNEAIEKCLDRVEGKVMG